MRNILNLVIQEKCDMRNPNESVVSFEIREDVSEPEKALRAAVDEFVMSDCDEARRALESSNYCFNWGDSMCSISDEIFIKHGLTPIKDNSVDVFVDHDEILCCNSGDFNQAKIKRLIKNCISKNEGNTERYRKLAALMEQDSYTVFELQKLSNNVEDEVLTALFDEMLEILLHEQGGVE